MDQIPPNLAGVNVHFDSIMFRTCVGPPLVQWIHM